MGVSSENLRRYAIQYRDPDPTCPIFTWHTRAYDADHARERFLESSLDDGWDDAVIVSVTLAKEGSK